MKTKDRNMTTLPVSKNERYIITIKGLTHEGMGVGQVDGFTLFVDGALPGDKAEVKVIKVKKKYGYAKLMEVLESGEYRVQPDCVHFSSCGGCQLQHLRYEQQLQYKQQQVFDNLQRIGKLNVTMVNEDDTLESEKVKNEASHQVQHETIVHPTLGMEHPWAYRNKAMVPFGQEEGAMVAGFYAPRTHRIIDMESCMIQHEQNDNVILAIKQIASELGISTYDEMTHTGLLRQVMVRTGFHTGEVMVVFITNGRKIPHKQQWIDRITSQFPQVKSICQNINEKRTNTLLGHETIVLWGQKEIYDHIGDVRFAISATSFYQVNPEQTKILYDKALQYADLSGEEIVIDAYCGIGTISLFLAQHAKKVYGVEIVEQAIKDATYNATLNHIDNVVFETGKAEEVIPAWKQNGVMADVIVVDPPRKGCDKTLLDTIIEMTPKRVVYVSCNPSTLARDVHILTEGGYKVMEVQPVDMFPHTTHVETVALLVKV
ncbi:23S rRNA (uracil(1939)-C(5))-methyltransferase RlmD [Longirhabdus pacifica]|uniref:23S rRNA (uracil(1939)-C(5))-methyltransferase RlmD n=1 Tax=Longirhabdus pacifica TaxID=2305227 RepID=UPI001F0B7450|nr:23S rRNA (uracil(1939)-C(5))-methyltransferase RlmD [Longirhabdus pacifica]